MQPSVQRVTELFEQQRRFVVPLFQRSYVWTFEQQWHPLWEDVERQARKLERAHPEAPLPSDATHFMGAIVVQNEAPGGAGRPPVSTIIDGQQRLITFQILLAAIRDHLRTRKDAYLAHFEACTANHEPHLLPEDRFKVWPTNADRNSFRDAMTTGSTTVLPNSTLHKAYSFFRDEFESFIRSDGSDDDVDVAFPPSTEQSRINAVFNALRHAFRFVVIQLDEHEDPQIIFESLNGRGQPLLPSDLIKNYLFLEAGDRAEELYNGHWQHFEEQTWRKDLPRLRRPMVDIFFQHYLTEKPNRVEVDINQLYLEFKQWRLQTRCDQHIEQVLRDIHTKSDCFAMIVQGRCGPRVARIYEFILATDTFVAMPLLIHVLSRVSDTGPVAQVLDLIESFIVRRWFCERSSRNQASVYAKILDGVRGCENEVIESVVRAQLAQSETKGKKSWPQDEEFESAWRTRQLYYKTRPERAKAVLSALEKASRGEGGHGDHFSLEHVLPQEADENTYPFARNDTYQANAERRKRLLDTVGNLTILEKLLNQQAGNASFALKKAALANSDIKLNSYFSNLARWDEDEIERRASRLFEIARNIWPRPAEPA